MRDCWLASSWQFLQRSGARSGAYVLSAHAIAAGKRRPAAARYFSSAVISKRLGWFVVLIAAAVATVVGILMPLFVPVVPFGKGGGGPSLIPYQVPSALMLAGMAGMVVGVIGIVRSRPSWRRLSVLSVGCGAVALLLEFPWWPFPGGYAGIWLGGLLGLVAIGTAIGAFSRPMLNKALDLSLAVAGLLAGLICALFVSWILLITVSGGWE